MQQDLEAHQPLLKERENLVKEKEDLVQQVTLRTTERNSAQTQLDSVRKGLRALLGQADAASPANRTAVTVSRTGG
jgi:hypothetical protein